MSQTNSARTKTLVLPAIRRVVLIGCGGTGSILAEHLARMIAGYRLECELVLIDGDRVEEANIARQNFQPHEIGANKARAIAMRLAGQFGLEVEARESHAGRFDSILDPSSRGDLVITATDTLRSRRHIAERGDQLWLDVGNSLHHGQAVIGTTEDPAKLRKAFWGWHRRPHVICLPNVAAMNPRVRKGREPKASPSCADQPFALQGFGVNAMAAMAAMRLAQQALVEQTLRDQAIYFNVKEGWMRARAITKDIFNPWKQIEKK